MPNTRALKMSKRNKFTFILKIKKNKMSYNVFYHGTSCTIQTSANRVYRLNLERLSE